MRITIQASADGGTELETDRELHRAFVVLHNVVYSNTRRRQICGQFGCYHSRTRNRRAWGARRAKAGGNTSAGVLI